MIQERVRHFLNFYTPLLVMFVIIGGYVLFTASSTPDWIRNPQDVAEVIVENVTPLEVQEFQEEDYNPRSGISRGWFSEEVIVRYFDSLNTGEYEEACSLLSRDQCNARRSIVGFSHFTEGLKGGYSVEEIYEAAGKKGEKIFCVRYAYRLQNDLSPDAIVETMQYHISTRPDSVDEISARICEKITKGDRVRPCPIEPEVRYCIDNI